MTIEAVNLVASKRVAGDVQWLKDKYIELHREVSIVVHGRIAAYLACATGFHSMAAFEMAAPVKQRVEVYAFLCGILIRKDYDKLTVSPNQEEIEHSQLMERLDHILKHPELAAKITISIETHK